MNADITATAPLDAATLLPGLKWSESRKRTLRWLNYGFIVAAALFAFWLGASDGKVELQDVLPSMLAIGFLVFIIRRSSDYSGFVRQLEQLPGYGGPITWVIRQDGYGCKDEAGETQNLSSWAEVFETVATPEGVLIYRQKGVPEWLPKNAFTEEEYARFLDIVAARTRHSKIG